MNSSTRILKHIHVFVDYLEAKGTSFISMDGQTRFICNFLERKIKKLRYRTEGFSSICIIGRSSPRQDCYVNSEKVMEVEVPFKVDDYGALSDGKLTELACTMLRSGLHKCDSQAPIPLDDLIGALDEFQASGCINQWTHCSKLARAFNCRWTINCSLTMHEFWLDLIVTRKDDVLVEEEVFRTSGDDFAWVPLFKDAKLEDGQILIWGQVRELTYVFDLTTLTGTRTEFLENWGGLC